MTSGRWALVLGVPVAVGLAISLAFPGFWWTRDQRAVRALGDDDAERAASLFADPMWRGVAHYRAGDFEQAAGLFSGLDTAEGAYNRGNALVFLGTYDEAVASYDRALELRGGWREAEENRALALARAAALEFDAGNMTGGKLGADDIVFDQDGGDDAAADEVEVGGDEATSGAELQARWLRGVQTTPADFLRLKFGYQLAERAEGGSEE